MADDQAARAKLTITRSTESEVEADRISEQILRAPGNSVSARDLRGNPGSAHRVADLPLVQETIAASGQPLDPSVREFMEPRFGHDFGDVRLHTNEKAAASARGIGARAYTAGRNIVFADGQYSPRTERGQRLLAHELAHTIQQEGRSDLISRKEVDTSDSDDLQPEDWTGFDRHEWETASQENGERELPQTNTFITAASYNTRNNRPKEYQSVRERHDYYDVISYVLEHDPQTPAALQDIRFFHAATAVTGHPGIGTVDTVLGAGKLHPETRQILRDVNEELFAINVSILQRMLFGWREPRDPRQHGNQRIDTFEFDLRMVETEQSAVEEFIRKNQQRFTSTVTEEVNRTLDPEAFGQFFNFSRTSFEWAGAALGVKHLDFTKLEHRKAIGFASVHIFHRKSQGEYNAFMKQKRP